MKRITFIAFIMYATVASGAGKLPGSIRQFIDNKSVALRYEIDNEYLLYLIEKYVGKILSSTPMDTEDMMKLDVLLTDAFMLLGSHLYYGKVDPEKEGANWQMQRKEPELRLDLKLEEALAANDPAMGLNMLAPRYRSYWMMKEELAFFLGLKEYRGTPVFNEQITYIVFSPSWTIPPTILQEDVIPELLKGSEYIERKNMKLLRPDGSELDV